MSVAVLVVYVSGLMAAFGWRTVWQLRHTGRSGWVGVSRRAGPAARVGGGLFAAALISGLIGVIVAVAWPTAIGVPPFVGGLGLVLTVAGVVLVVMSQMQMGLSWRIGVDPGERTDLVTDGLFGWVRNPVFTGMVAVQLGVAVVVPSWWTAAAVLALIAAVQIQVRAVEEPYLRRVQGAQYQRYAARVGRFLPRVGMG